MLLSMLALEIGGLLNVTYQLGQIHFRFSCLKAVCKRGLGQLLELIRARAFQEEIRIAADVFNRRKRDGVDSLLYDVMPPRGKFSNPKSEQSHELIDLISRQRSIDSAISFRQVRVIVLCA